jgi:NCS1 family nucleobase:cation symporter-1
MGFVETRSIDYVPLVERHGKAWHLWPVWFVGDAHLATLATGTLGIAGGLDLFWASIAIIGGGLLGTLFMALHSSQGPELGLPQMIQSRPQFGYFGALLVWGVALVTYIGYNAFNQSLAAATVHELTGLPPAAVIVVFAAAAIAVALAGYDFIHRAQRVLAVLLMVTLLFYTVGMGRIADLPHLLTPHRLVVKPFLIAFFAAAAYQLSWSIYVSDYSRYLPRSVGIRQTFGWTFVGGFIGGAWMMLVGAFAAALFGAGDIVEALRRSGEAMAPGFGWVMLVVSFGGLLTVTGLNFYGASLTLLSIVDTFSRVPLGKTARLFALAAVLVVTMALSLGSGHNLMADFQALLAVLLYLFTPWTAINLVDFFLVRRGRYSIRAMFMRDGIYGRWNWRGLAAYAIGFASMVPFFSTETYTGPVAAALGGADISMLVGLPVSALVYWAACRGLDLSTEHAAIAVLDANLELGDLR